jgi:predicted DNA binding protein
MKLELRIPPKIWYGEFTRKHPELVVEQTNTMSVGSNDTLGEYEIYGPPVDWTNEIAASSGVIEVESLDARPAYGRYQVRYRRSSLLALQTKFEVLARYPRTAKNGILECELIARRSHMRRAVEALAKAGNEPRLISLHRDSLRSVRLTLTPVQSALLRQALVLGYFEVPRGITLTQLAKKVSRSKSSVSRTLAVVERKLVETAYGPAISDV